MDFYTISVVIVGSFVLLILGWYHWASQIPPEWLMKRMDEPDVKGTPGSTFNRRKNHDEIWWFSSPPASWEHQCGQSGIAVVRKGKIISARVMMRN